MKRGRTFDKIIAIIAGIAIWTYVIGVKDPVTTDLIKSIPVQLVNVESMENAGLAIAGTGEYTVDLVVGGNRSAITDAKVGDFIATADVSGLHIGQNYITVEVEAPSNLTINEIRTQKIQVYVDTAVTKDVNLRIFTANLPEGTELGSIEASTSQVKLMGAESLVNNVADVKATIDTKDRTIDETITEDIELIPVDSEGNRVIGVKLSENKATIKSTLYQTKEVALNVPIEGELNDHIKLRSEIVPSSVVIKGPQNLLADIWQIDAEAIDRSQVTESCSIPVSLILPSGIEASHSSRDIAVDYEIQGRVDKNISFAPEDVAFTGLAGGLNGSISDNIDLGFSLYADQLESFSKANVQLSVDCQGLVAGEYELPLEIKVDEELGVLINENAPKTIKVVIE